MNPILQVITEVSQKCGVDESEIHSALLSDDLHNPLVVAYNLVSDNKRIENAKNDEYREFLSGSGTQYPHMKIYILQSLMLTVI